MDIPITKIIASYLLKPFTLSLLLLSAGIVLLLSRKRQKMGRSLIVFGLVLLVLLSIPLVPNEIARRLEYCHPPIVRAEDIPDDIAWVVVLSGASIDNAYVPITSRNIRDTLHRVVEGVVLAEKLPKAKLLLSGGAVFDAGTASKVMAEMAFELHFPADRIVTESKSLDTEDQAAIIANIVGKERVLLVTSALHMPRSVMLFKAYGMDPLPAPTAHISTTRPRLLSMLFPSAGALAMTENVAHELIGMAWFKLKNILTSRKTNTL
jgi:uncharacterized SAM-binding protein YcdF (DUF218 family)